MSTKQEINQRRRKTRNLKNRPEESQKHHMTSVQSSRKKKVHVGAGEGIFGEKFSRKVRAAVHESMDKTVYLW